MLWLAQGLAVATDLADAVMDPAHAPPWWTVALAIAGCVMLLAPRGWPHRWLGALWCLPLFIVVPPTVPPGEVPPDCARHRPGTAVIVQTAHHTLVYDTGPRWTDSADAGSRLIAPICGAAEAGTFMGWSSVISISTIAAARGRCSTRCRWTGC